MHYVISREFLLNGVHVLVEKPICETLGQADELIEISDAKGVILQVGHLERFNPALKCATSELNNPRYIECRRFCRYPNRNTEMAVEHPMFA